MRTDTKSAEKKATWKQSEFRTALAEKVKNPKCPPQGVKINNSYIFGIFCIFHYEPTSHHMLLMPRNPFLKASLNFDL